MEIVRRATSTAGWGKLALIWRRRKEKVAIVNKTNRRLCLSVDYVLLMYLEPFEEGTIMKSLCQGKVLAISQGGKGHADPVKKLSSWEITRLDKIVITEQYLKMGMAILQIERLQKKFIEWRKENRRRSASKIQALVRGVLQRRLVCCLVCEKESIRANVIAVWHTTATTFSSRAKTLHSVDAFFEELSFAGPVQKVYVASTGWKQFVCHPCFVRHVEYHVLQENQIEIPCFHDCDAIIPDRSIGRFCKRAILLTLYDNRRNVGARINTLQAHARGKIARRRLNCPICLDSNKAGLMLSLVHGARKCSACRTCIKSMLLDAIKSGKSYVPCFNGCGDILSLSTIKLILGTKFVDQIMRNQAEEHQRYLEYINDGKGEFSFASWCHAYARVCPSCRVLIFRDEGCNDMLCVCGARFFWNTAEQTKSPHRIDKKRY